MINSLHLCFSLICNFVVSIWFNLTMRYSRNIMFTARLRGVWKAIETWWHGWNKRKSPLKSGPHSEMFWWAWMSSWLCKLPTTKVKYLKGGTERKQIEGKVRNVHLQNCRAEQKQQKTFIDLRKFSEWSWKFWANRTNGWNWNAVYTPLNHIIWYSRRERKFNDFQIKVMCNLKLLLVNEKMLNDTEKVEIFTCTLYA